MTIFSSLRLFGISKIYIDANSIKSDIPIKCIKRGNQLEIQNRHGIYQDGVLISDENSSSSSSSGYTSYYSFNIGTKFLYGTLGLLGSGILYTGLKSISENDQNPFSPLIAFGGFGLLGYSIWNFFTSPSSITLIQKRGPSRYFFGAVPTRNVADISIGNSGSGGESVSGSGNQSVSVVNGKVFINGIEVDKNQLTNIDEEDDEYKKEWVFTDDQLMLSNISMNGQVSVKDIAQNALSSNILTVNTNGQSKLNLSGHDFTRLHITTNGQSHVDIDNSNNDKLVVKSNGQSKIQFDRSSANSAKVTTNGQSSVKGLVIKVDGTLRANGMSNVQATKTSGANVSTKSSGMANIDLS